MAGHVDPSGPDSDHLYHGLIGYPGSGGLVRFSAASQSPDGWTFQVPANVQDNLSLNLGFEDDNYGDNGYWGHDRDNGPDGQCPVPGTPYEAYGKPAWVTITIATMGTPTPNKAMDLISDTVDPNGLPLNPWWAYEKGVDRLPSDPQGPPDPDRQCGLTYVDPDNVDRGINLLGDHCTTQSPSVNQGTGFSGELCRHAATPGVLAGHLNWFVSTYTGKIRWQDYSGTPLDFGDNDYNFTLFPDSGTGLTAARPEWIGLEFYSNEVVDRIDKGWWNDFHNLVDTYSGPDGGAAQRIRDAPAIAIGQMGLDSEHGAYSELHPVYGLAIRVNSDAGHVGTDDWVFLARNFGNEGYCADGNLTVPELSTLSFFIPRDNSIGDDPASPTALDELYSTSDNNSVALSFVQGGAVITFNVGPPSDQTIYSGHVQFHWKLNPTNPVRGKGLRIGAANLAASGAEAIAGGKPTVSLNAKQVMQNGVPLEIDVDAEGLKEKVFASLPSALRPRLNALLAEKPVIPHAAKVRRVEERPDGRRIGASAGLIARSSPIYRAMPRYIRAIRMPDPARAQQEAQLLKLYCDAYPDGKSPNVTVRSCSPSTIKPRPSLPNLAPSRIRVVPQPVSPRGH